jgi:nitrite reductase/ring-hydroxylating ferredoxin subunit
MPEFVPAINLGDLREGEIVGREIGGEPLAFYLIDGQPYCTTDVCTHEFSLLSDGGFVEGGQVECPLHGARYDVKTGKVLAPPAFEPLRRYPVEVRDGVVYVALR